MQQGIPLEIFESILKDLEHGNNCMDEKSYMQAFNFYSDALDKVPKEKEDWHISLDIYYALGESSFYQEEYNMAIYFFNKALLSPDGLASWKVWFGLGKCFHKQNLKKEAQDAFIRAYMLEGKEIFNENKEYIKMIQDFF